MLRHTAVTEPINSRMVKHSGKSNKQSAKATPKKGSSRSSARAEQQSVHSARVAQLAAQAAKKYANIVGAAKGWAPEAESAADRYCLGLYEPEIESRGPAQMPQNTFLTTHRINTVVSNIDVGGTTRNNLALAIGSFPTLATTTASAPISTFLSSWGAGAADSYCVGLMQCQHANGAEIGTASALTTPIRPSVYTPGVTADKWWSRADCDWDSAPYLYASGASGVNVQPHRIVGLKVVLECTSAPLYLQGSIRGGDNGTIFMTARRVAGAASPPAGGTQTNGVGDDIFEPFWPDQISGYSDFSKDPRVRELGPIRRGSSYEFFWVPTCPDQVAMCDSVLYEASTIVPKSGTGSSATPLWNVGNVLRRAPTILINLSGLGNTNTQTFRVRATMAVEHVVTPYGNGFLYDYSRKAPFFILPWDRMAMLPTSGAGPAVALIEAGRLLEDGADEASPSLTRAIAGYNGRIPTRADTGGVINTNGATVAVGVGMDKQIAQAIHPSRASRFWAGTKAFLRGAYGEAKSAIKYGLEHEQQLKTALGIGTRAARASEAAAPLMIMA